MFHYKQNYNKYIFRGFILCVIKWIFSSIEILHEYIW